MHLLGGRVGGDIKILGMVAQHQVAHRAAYQIALITLATKPGHDLECAIANISARNGVAVPGNSGHSLNCGCHVSISQLQRRGGQSTTRE